ncbi:hypothetical protein FEM48_Zijuj02G0021800 [Ziziphus jujuba var. spinosa]|uniref:Plastocyanin-like domain-containing protein n=1 Tax=Ziziphus jujuba var. spinosa TaxID=714518 RepID=A0A978VT07_ZIZJJ|nr:hypothetical protein FEM48_Zijuj02G0021800 [Ziziphus jujuba var. spinosa]
MSIYIMFIYIMGEWWNADPEAVSTLAMQTGGGPNVSNAYTLNGLPGTLYNCTAKENLLIALGQTTNVHLKTKTHYPNTTFCMTARPYVTGLGTFDNSTVAVPNTALLQAHYFGQSNGVYTPGFPSNPIFPFNYTMVGNGKKIVVLPFNTGVELVTLDTSILGDWFMHCHLEIHTSWGLKMGWLVLDGKLPNQKLLPPPADLPKC